MARQRPLGRKKWLWRIVLLALPLVVMGALLARLKTWRPRPTLALQGQTIQWLAWTPDGERLAILSAPNVVGNFASQYEDASYDTAQLSLWRVADAKKLWSKKAIETPCVMSKDGRIFTNGEDVNIFDDQGHLLNHEREGTSIFTVGGHWLAQGDDGRPLVVWDLNKSVDDDTPRILGADGQFCHDIALSPDGALLASTDSTDLTHQNRKDDAVRVINLWDVKAGKMLRRISTGRIEVEGMTFSPDGKQLVGRINTTVVVWDTATAKVVRRVPLASGTHVAFSPDGRWIGAETGTALKIYDAKTGALKRTLAPAKKTPVAPPPPPPASNNSTTSNSVVGNAASPSASNFSAFTPSQVGSFAFSPDSATVAVGYSDGVITLWRVK